MGHHELRAVNGNGEAAVAFRRKMFDEVCHDAPPSATPLCICRLGTVSWLPASWLH
jgi:hypothetical protein